MGNITEREAIQIALESLKKVNATGDVIFNKNKTLSISAEKGKLGKYLVAGNQVIGVRSIKENKVGIGYSESLTPKAIKKMVENTVNFSLWGDDEVLETIDPLINKELKGEKTVTVEDTSTSEEKIALSLDLESAVLKKDNRAKSSPYNGLSQIESKHLVANTSGGYCEETEHYFSCYTSCLAEEGQKKAMHYHSDVALCLSELNFQRVVEESVHHATKLLSAKPITTATYDVIFSPDMLDALFSVFSSLFSGKKAMEGINPWKDKLDKSIAASSLSLMDNPKHSRGFFKFNFDGEGREKKPITIIEKGRLNSLLHNTKTAKYFNTVSTGSAIRGMKSALDVAPYQLVISPGGFSKSELTSGLYLEIIDLSGLHSGANPVSGQFSFGASGYLRQDGETIQPLKEITVSGNFFQLLNDIKMIGNEILVSSDKNFITPLIRFSNVSVAGD